MDPTEELRYLIRAVDKEGELIFSDLLKPFSITPSQNEILKILSANSGLSVSQIGELLICGSDNPSRLIDRLMLKGLVEKKRNPADTRVVNIFITPEGRALLEKTTLIEDQFNRQIEENLKNQITVDAFIDLLKNQIQGSKTLQQIEKAKELL